MSVSVGTDSYVTLAEASAYLAARLHTTAWDSAGDGDKEKSLKQAAKAIDRQPLVGRRKDPDQSLAFPRCYVAPPGEASGYLSEVLHGWCCESAVPQAVKDAQCEEALGLLERSGSSRLALQRAGVRSIGIGSLSETYGRGAGRGLLSQEARELLRPYLAGAVTIR